MHSLTEYWKMKTVSDVILATTKKNWKELENEKSRGKKRYQERIAEEKEAEQLIKEYKEEQEEDCQVGETLPKYD
jgi:replication initiation and membrane attachment protein DnaB